MLRQYQKDAISKISLNQNDLLVLPTGAGKTYTFCSYLLQMNLPGVVMAHRCELVGQMSLQLAEMNVPHRIIASDATIREAIQAHKIVVGKVFYDPTAPTICASVDTIIRRVNPKLYASVRIWIVDEAHHLLRNNKWGRAVELFPNASGLGVTATPMRADGKGLGAHADGVFHNIIEGPTGDDLIEMGYLSPYRIKAPSMVSDLDYSSVQIGSTGDLKQNQLRTATKASRQLVGSMVDKYLLFAKEKLGLTFCVDIEHAEDTAEEYRAKGVPSACVSSKTPFLQRIKYMQDFKDRKLLQLVNVDLFGEGTDVPGVEVVSMGRKTASFPVYSQQKGRMLRPVYAKGMPLNTDEERKLAIALGPKPYALLIDHVGNVGDHKLSTTKKEYTLDRTERRGKSEVSNEFKLKNCDNELCAASYPAYLTRCQFCGQAPKPRERLAESPIIVDGDLIEVDLNVLRGLKEKADAAISGVAEALPMHLPSAAHARNHRLALDKAEAQKKLREAISIWAGYQKARGLDDIREIQKMFFLKFDIDVLTAQTLNYKDSINLLGRLNNDTAKLSN